MELFPKLYSCAAIDTRCIINPLAFVSIKRVFTHYRCIGEILYANNTCVSMDMIKSNGTSYSSVGEIGLRQKTVKVKKECNHRLLISAAQNMCQLHHHRRIRLSTGNIGIQSVFGSMSANFFSTIAVTVRTKSIALKYFIHIPFTTNYPLIRIKQSHEVYIFELTFLN